MSHAMVYRLAVREALRVELQCALAAIRRATHVAHDTRAGLCPAVYCYGSEAECAAFADGLRAVRVRPITNDDRELLTAHKIRVYQRANGA